MLLALGAGPAAAQLTDEAGSQTSTLGNVSATLRWDKGDFGPKNVHLTIARAGVTALDAAIPVRKCAEGNVACVIVPTGKDDLRVRDLNKDGEPEVLVDGFTRGAHCCTTLAIYHWTGTGYGEILRTFLSSGYGLKDFGADGLVEIVTDDVRFEDLFTSHATSFEPAQVLRFDGGRLRDVTRRFPGEVRKNAAQAKKLFKVFKPGSAGVRESRGVIAAYVADQYLLGRSGVGLRELDRQIRIGRLGTRTQGRAFRRQLLRYLDRFGYR